MKLDFDLFQLEEWRAASRKARMSHGSIYTWKTVGRSNWLEKRPSVVDALGLVVLPAWLPDYIDLPDDSPTDSEYAGRPRRRKRSSR